MNQKVIQATPFLIGLVYIIFWNLTHSTINSDALWSLAQVIYIYILFTIPVTIIVFFLPRKIFFSWLRFFSLFSLLFLFLLFGFLERSGQIFIFFSNNFLTTHFFGPVLVLGSLITIGISWLRSRKA